MVETKTFKWFDYVIRKLNIFNELVMDAKSLKKIEDKCKVMEMKLNEKWIIDELKEKKKEFNLNKKKWM
jgi:hypothetical protein